VGATLYVYLIYLFIAETGNVTSFAMLC